jgi:hypothetical protein
MMRSLKRRACALLLVCSIPTGLATRSGAAQRGATADVYVTAKATGDKLAKKEPLVFEPLEQPDEHDPTIMLDASKTFHTRFG